MEANTTEANTTERVWLGYPAATTRTGLSVPIFSELEARLVATFGPTAEALMLHQLCYWFSREMMRDR